MNYKTIFLATSCLLVAAASLLLVANTEAKKPPKTWLVKVTDSGGGAFEPIALSIRKGQAVRWRAWDTWSDQPGFTDIHNVALASGPPGVKKKNLSSNPIGTSTLNFRRVLKVAGNYSFICSLHPGSMQMSISVSK